MFSQENSFTDDTVCTVAVADAIAKGRDYGESIHEWCRRYSSPMGGYGGRFRQWVMSDEPKPYGSYGNGSAMRVSPVAWHYDTAEDVLREAICNAIVHRDYMGVHTQMKVYDDCIMLWNDGKLPEGIDQEKLFAEHASQPRNRNIANAFYKAGFIETWGRGINKIRQGLKKEGLPEPKIENHVSGTLITIYRNVGVNGTNDTNNVGNMSETNVGNMSETNLTERQRFILSSIKKNPLITGKEMSETLSVTQRTVERDLAAMQKAGIIRHEGKVNAGVWVVLEKPQKKD